MLIPSQSWGEDIAIDSSFIKNNLNDINKNIAHCKTKIIAVTKYFGLKSIIAGYEAGIRDFAESRAKEGSEKINSLPDEVKNNSNFHFIGHLQTNKVKYIAPYISMIEAVDSLRLLREIDRQAAKHNRVIDVLLELHIAEEETKYGLTFDACRELLAGGEWRTMEHIRICGLMMMASFVDDTEQIRCEMLSASHFFDEVKQQYFADEASFKERSWGMSHDFPIAVQCHSTMVRVGTTIFGPRIYGKDG